MNVALIVLDTLRKDRISPYNRAIEHTPNLQAFADTATTYTNAISQAPWSLPAHASLLTGLYPWQHGASQQYPYLRKGTLLQNVLGGEGFRTVAIHDNEWLIPVTGVTDGFDRVVTPVGWSKYLRRPWRVERLAPVREHAIRWSSRVNFRRAVARTSDLSREVAATESFLRTRGEDPFFLFMNLINAHFPYNPPETYASERACDCRSRPLENGGPVDPTEYEQLRRLYDAEVAYLDEVFGRIIRAFKRFDAYEETLFVVVGDHGELLGEDDIVGHHFSVRDELIEVPLFVRTPERDNETENEIVETRELYYRICQAAGVEIKDEERLFPDRASGIYQRPVIYGDRLPPGRQELNTFQFYTVGPTEKRVITDAENRIERRLGIDADTDACHRGESRHV